MKKNKHKLKIMLSSNAPWSPSGYAQQAVQFLPLMAKEGYKTSCVAFYGLEGGNVNIEGVEYYPKIPGDTWGDSAVVNHQKHFKPDVIFTLQDIWTLNPEHLKKFNKWIPIVPIDHEPTPPAILERLKLAYRVVTYSQFGHRQLKDEGIHSTYIPHTVKTDVFKPMGDDFNLELRKTLGIPADTFLFGVVAANKDNPPRKGFEFTLEAFKRFNQEYPNSALYFHTLLDQAGGFPIRHYAKHLGIEKHIYHTDPYNMLHTMQQSDMAQLYNVFDAYLSPSLNEGFGVPIIEAQSCGVPAIATDFTAMRDLIVDGETGYKIKVGSTRFTPLLSNVAVPDVNSLYESMVKVYKADRKAMGKKARDFILKNYDLDLVWKNNWMPFLEKLEKEIYS
jgi:glycosyltransferase involved in cell wall biosynthesis